METDESVPFRTEFWGICCESGKKYTQIVQKKFRVTKAILELPAKDTNSVVSLMVERGDLKYLLCHLKPYTILQADLNLYFDKGEEISFLIKGQGKVHVIGYHIYGKDDLLLSSDESNFNSSVKKSIVSESKFENSNFKEVKISRKSNEKDNCNLSIKKENDTKEKKVQDKPKLKKAEDSEDDSSDESSNEAVTSAKKSLPVNKKNAKNKKNVEESDEDDPFEELESTEDEESGEDEGLKKVETKKRLWSALTQDDDDYDEEEDDDYNEEDDDEEEDEEDSDESDSDDEDMPKEKAKISQETKKMKKDPSTPLSNKKSTPNLQTKSIKVVDLDDSSVMNSSIGRTPMPKKKQAVNANQTNLSLQKSSPQKTNSAKTGASGSGMENSAINASPKKNEINATVPLSESKKKKKKKKKSVDGLNTSNDAMKTDTSKPAKLSLSSASYSQKLPGGLEYEDVRIGNGPVAKKGRIVHVYYTGMLENNKVFDSRENNTKPFSFKLGAQRVITGWDLGIEGMKVGGKRRLKVPPHLGYKNQKMGPIPANSTLYFNVELKAVS